MAATKRFVHQSRFKLGQAQAWLRADPNLRDEQRAFLSAAEPSFEYKLREIANAETAMAASEDNIRRVRRAVVALVLYDRMALCDRWLGDCQKLLPPLKFPPFTVRPLDPPEYRLAQVDRWWNGAPVKGEGDFYINKAMTLTDDVYNGMILRLESLRATATPVRNLPALRLGSV